MSSQNRKPSKKQGLHQKPIEQKRILPNTLIWQDLSCQVRPTRLVVGAEVAVALLLTVGRESKIALRSRCRLSGFPVGRESKLSGRLLRRQGNQQALLFRLRFGLRNRSRLSGRLRNHSRVAVVVEVVLRLLRDLRDIHLRNARQCTESTGGAQIVFVAADATISAVIVSAIVWAIAITITVAIAIGSIVAVAAVAVIRAIAVTVTIAVIRTIAVAITVVGAGIIATVITAIEVGQLSVARVVGIEFQCHCRGVHAGRKIRLISAKGSG